MSRVSLKQKVLFEIPVYSMKEDVFNRKWDKHQKYIIDHFATSDISETEVSEALCKVPHPESIWKYNQIIGYIVISVTKSDVFLDIYKSLDKRYYAVSKSKHFIQDLNVTGYHFYAENISDEGIHREIRNWLREIENNNIKKTHFIDYSVFFNIFDEINIKNIMRCL